jgi:hypothetical protein
MTAWLDANMWFTLGVLCPLIGLTIGICVGLVRR